MPATPRIPIPPGLRAATRAGAGRDLLAGLSVWAVLVPEALAYAAIAGVNPVLGLYAAPPALLLYACFGSSRHLSVGPTAATAALSAATVAGLVHATGRTFTEVTVALALTVGVLAVVAALARLGFIASFISQPVLTGFIIGLALTIIVGQAPKLLGLPSNDGNFFTDVWDLGRGLGDVQGPTAAVGVAALVLLLLLRRFAPRWPRAIIVVAGGIVAAHLFDLGARGVALVGHIPAGLPTVGLPHASARDYAEFSGAAIGILLIAFAEGLGAARSFADRDRLTIDPDRELLGLGVANVGAALCGGLVVGGSLSKTAVNHDAGARSQVSGIALAALTLLTLLLLTGLFEQLPQAVLGAIVIAAVVDLVDLRALRRLARLSTRSLDEFYGLTSRADFIAAVAALIGVLVFDTLPGLGIGIGVSVVLLVYRTSRPHVAVLGRLEGPNARWVDHLRHPEAPQPAGVVVVRPEAGLTFVNADNVRAAIRNAIEVDTHAVVLDLETVGVVDSTAASMLVALDEELHDRGIRLLLARQIGPVHDLLRTAGAVRLESSVYSTIGDAVRAAQGETP